jgi:phage shock protein PspC (stress-responsive transcriptional regulator)
MTETPEQERANPDPNRMNSDNLRNYTQLRRTTYDRKIAGVAGGLARHLNIDPIIVRVVFVVLIFFGGAGLVLYGAAWLLVPEDTGKPAAVHVSDSTRNALLIVAAAFSTLLLIGDSWGGFDFPWFLALVALIVFGVLMSRDNAPTPPPAAPPAAPPTTPAPPTDAPSSYAVPQPGAAYAGGDQTPTTELPYTYTGSQYGWQPVDPYAPPAATKKQKKQKQGPILFGITLALIAAGIGTLGLIDAVSDASVPDAAYPALALAITGGMLVVGAFWGRPGGLILVGTISAIAMAGAALAGPTYDGDRDIVETPRFASEVDAHYSVPAGRIELDLRQVSDLGELNGQDIDLDANAGELVVILPEGLSADVDADVDFGGAITLPGGDEDGGWGYSRDAFIGDVDDPTIELKMDVKFGHIEVRQGS